MIVRLVGGRIKGKASAESSVASLLPKWRAGGLHWMSAVFEVIALGIAGRDGQQAAGSTRQERHREIRARKRQRGNREREAECDLVSEEETKGSEVESEMDFDSG